MDHPRIDDEKVIDRYLKGELAAEEEELFEEHLFACAPCLEHVKAGEALRLGLRTVAAEEGARELARVAVSRDLAALTFLAWWHSRRPGQRQALAALALVVLVLPVLWLRQHAELGRLRGELAARGSGEVSGPRADLLVVSLGVVRGAGEEAELRLDPLKSTVVLSLELPLTATARYDATLFDGEGRERWRGEGLEPNLYGTLLIVVPSTFLAPGPYRVSLESPSVNGSTPAGEVRFRVVGEDASPPAR